MKCFISYSSAGKKKKVLHLSPCLIQRKNLTTSGTIYTYVSFCIKRSRVKTNSSYFCSSTLQAITNQFSALHSNGKGTTRRRTPCEGFWVGCQRSIWPSLSFQLLQKVTFMNIRFVLLSRGVYITHTNLHTQSSKTRKIVT